ncbi:MAG TPA: secretin N-terminal domain-containing protein [Thermoanaerobaculia bacterium]|nr:secretin N-terminal domain-containing protein [Thermoanaerobaculia bacterium]
MKRIVLVLALLIVSVNSHAAEPVAAPTAKPSLAQKVFHFQHKAADTAASMIKPLMSSDGSVAIQPTANTLVVTDYADNLRSISDAIAKFDTDAQRFHLELKLVAASRVTGTPPVTPDDLKEIAGKLSGVLRFNAFEKVGDLSIDGRESDPVTTELKSADSKQVYRAEFKFGEYDPVSDSIRVNDFKLGRLQGQEITSLLKTSLNLKVGQTVVLGAAKLPDSQKALMMIIVARRSK